MSELSTLTLFPAMPAQLIESRRRTFTEWGIHMTEEQYLLRDALMDNAEHAANARLITWVLCPREDPTTLEFKCSCETYRRDGLLLRKGPTGWDSEVREVPCYGIASVFTPERYRKRGYARHMMRLLHWLLAPHEVFPAFPEEWTLPERPAQLVPGYLSTLWSDVGSFYQYCGPTTEQEGWILGDATGTIWEVGEGINALGDQKEDQYKWRWLASSDLSDLWEREKEVMKRDMNSGHRALFSFLPGKGVEMFQRDRQLHVFERMRIPLAPCGVSLGEDTLVTWTIQEKPAPTLLITRVRVDDADMFAGVLALLLSVAKRYGLERIEMWNLASNLRGKVKELGGRNEVRTEHLPAFKWYGPEEVESVRWLNNERFINSGSVGANVEYNVKYTSNYWLYRN
ncbi:hypothetical protein BDZ89DRAFT_1057776 [Hymenopellis radicata]|nr:hypothetical protein BDZ89DRAFT_1057776 [Hymenopellis radicata]